MRFMFLAIIVSSAGFFGMMRMKADVQTLDRQRHTLVKKQYALNERTRILHADLAYLKNPLRLRKLAEKAGFVELTPLRILPFTPLPEMDIPDA